MSIACGTSSACDAAEASARTHSWPLWLARASALLGVLGGALAPHALRPLAWIPLATLAALIAFRPAARDAAFALDGALVAGALLALLWR